MKKIVRLTETDVQRLVKKILKEDFDPNFTNTLEGIFHSLTMEGDDFEVEFNCENGEECYVDVMGYGDWNQVYPYIEEAGRDRKSVV